MSFEIGDTVDAYKITGVVGRGGMGRVFRAEHTITRRVEAMKVVIGGRPDASEQAQRFLREIRLQASLSHPNIASVYHAFWLNSDLVLIMELVEGPSLQDLLEAGPIPLPTAIDYACQALRALSHAHSNGVVHRDVSPGNILVAPDGTVKLTDFGLAKSLAGPRSTQAGEGMGSVYYASPEQLKGLPTVDERTDVYSLGAVLYELVTGRPMFDADSLYDVMIAQIELTPQPPIEVRPEIPPLLNDVILTALSKQPAQRFQSAEAFLEALEPLKQIPGGTPAQAAVTAGAVQTGKPPIWSRFVEVFRAIRLPFTAMLRTGSLLLLGALLMAGLVTAVRYAIPSRSAPGEKGAADVQPLPNAESIPTPETAPNLPQPATPLASEEVAAASTPDMPKAVPAPPLRSARRLSRRLAPPPAPVPVISVRVELVPSEIPSRLPEPPAPSATEAIPDNPGNTADAELAAKKPRHWLWRALRRIPQPRFRGKPAAGEADAAASSNAGPPEAGAQP
jgi:serine/threonine-protein kinase